MNLPSPRFRYRSARSESGILLMECLVYLGLLSLVLGIAYSVFYQGWQSEQKLRRNTDEIALTMRTGERWRADVRAATGPLRLEQTAEQQVLHIPQSRGEVTYAFWQSGVWRDGPGQVETFLLLGPIKSSQMTADPRSQVTAWRWEIELKSKEHHRMVRPLFTFLAVPGATTNIVAKTPTLTP